MRSTHNPLLIDECSTAAQRALINRAARGAHFDLPRPAVWYCLMTADNSRLLGWNRRATTVVDGKRARDDSEDNDS